MTRESAQKLIARIRSGEVQIHHSRHAREELAAHGCGPHDVRAIIQYHEMRAAPEWVEKHGNFKVELWGKCLEGRPIAIILGLREEGPCVLVTVMPIEKKTLSIDARRRNR